MTRRKHFGPLSPEQQDLACTCLPLALKLAVDTHRASETVDLDALKSAAHFGLCQAAKAFDPARGYKLTTLAWPAILNALRTELKRDRRPRPAPISSYAEKNSVAVALDGLQAITPADCEELWQHLLTRLLPYDDDRGRLATILHRRRDGDTLQEIGDDLGVSKERIRQIVNTAVRRAGGMAAVLDGTGYLA